MSSFTLLTILLAASGIMGNQPMGAYSGDYSAPDGYDVVTNSPSFLK